MKTRIFLLGPLALLCLGASPSVQSSRPGRIVPREALVGDCTFADGRVQSGVAKQECVAIGRAEFRFTPKCVFPDGSWREESDAVVCQAEGGSVVAGIEPWACCTGNDCDDLPPEDCTGTVFLNQLCEDNPCVPALGTWGMIVMAILTCTAATMVLQRQRKLA